MNKRRMKLNFGNRKKISEGDVFKVITRTKNLSALCIFSDEEIINFCMRGGGKSIRYVTVEKSVAYQRDGEISSKGLKKSRVYFPQHPHYRLFDNLLNRNGIFK